MGNTFTELLEELLRFYFFERMTSRSVVLRLYKRLHRTAQSVFAGDVRMLDGARLKIRDEFGKNRHVTSQVAMEELVKVGEDAVTVLRTTVIQARKTDRTDPATGKSIYKARMTEDQLLDNSPFKEDVSQEEYAASVRAHKKKARLEREHKKLKGQPPTSCDQS